MSTTYTFNRFMRLLVRQHRINGHLRLSETYSSALRSFERFTQGNEIEMREMTPGLVEDYEEWLLSRNVSRNTVSFYMRILRAAYNRAVDSGLTRQRMPFKHVYTGVDKTRKRALSVAAIRRLKSLELSGTTALARDLFLFSFFTRGMSFIDMAFLRPENVVKGNLQYTRRKTGQTLVIRWEPCMQEIVDRYPANDNGFLLPIITRTGVDFIRQYRTSLYKVNRELHVLATLIKSPFPLTTYVARHSWASIAYSRNVPLAVISEGMGHDSERTTRIYLDAINNARVDRANRMVIRLL